MFSQKIYIYLQLSGKKIEFISKNIRFWGRIWAVFVFCVLCLHSAFWVMLGAKTMLGTTENMEFINILSLNTIFIILQVT